MTSSEPAQPAGSASSAPANATAPAGTNKPPVQRPVVSPLLSPGVDQATLDRLVYSVNGRQAVLVELDLSADAGADDIREQFRTVFHAAFEQEPEQPPEPLPISAHYMRCLLTQDEITTLAEQDKAHLAGSAPPGRTLYRIWPDYRMRAHIDRSVTTIKADAATRTYGTAGAGIVWAVIDSGIDKDHPHFAEGTVTDPAVSRLHRDFTGLLTANGTVPDDPAPALTDPLGHGTHVAGIIAGTAPEDSGKVLIAQNEPASTDMPSWVVRTLAPGRTLSGMAPKTRLVSLRVLDATGNTASSVVIEALAQVRAFNAEIGRAHV